MTEPRLMTAEAAEHFLARTPYVARLNLSVVGKHGGYETVPVCSAEEFVNVTRALEPVFDPAVLQEWVAEQLGDAELGAAIRAACEELPAFHQAPAAHELMAARLEEARSFGITH